MRRRDLPAPLLLAADIRVVRVQPAGRECAPATPTRRRTPRRGLARRRRTRCLRHGRRHRRRVRRRAYRSEVRCSRQACAATTRGRRGRPRSRHGSRSESAAASRRARTGTPGCRGWRSAVRRPRASAPRRRAASSRPTTSGPGCWGRTCPRRCAVRYPRFRDTCPDSGGGYLRLRRSTGIPKSFCSSGHSVLSVVETMI